MSGAEDKNRKEGNGKDALLIHPLQTSPKFKELQEQIGEKRTPVLLQGLSDGQKAHMIYGLESPWIGSPL